MEKNKITKVQVLSAIATLVTDETAVQVGNVTVTAADINDYVAKTIDQLNAKVEKARARAAEKKADGDALRDAVQAILTDEFQTIADITAQVDSEDVTPAKVTARLTQLVKAKLAHKTQVKVGDRKVNAYAVGPDPTDESDAE